MFRHDRIEVFPLGGFIYITDEVFETKPQLALKIVKRFFNRIEKLKHLAGPISPWQEVDDACLHWRLCVRPELMEYLLQHCEKHATELDNGDPEVTRSVHLMQFLAIKLTLNTVALSSTRFLLKRIILSKMTPSNPSVL